MQNIKFIKLKFYFSHLNFFLNDEIVSYKPPRSDISRVIQIPKMFLVFPGQLYFSIFLFIHMGILPLVSHSTKVNFSALKHIITMCVFIYI